MTVAGVLAPALAAMIAVAQVSTSSTAVETCTPRACRDYRAAAYLWRGIAQSRGVEVTRSSGDLADAEAATISLEAQALDPPQCPECASPAWSGWPWLAFGGGLVLGALAAIGVISAIPGAAP